MGQLCDIPLKAPCLNSIHHDMVTLEAVSEKLMKRLPSTIDAVHLERPRREENRCSGKHGYVHMYIDSYRALTLLSHI